MLRSPFFFSFFFFFFFFDQDLFMSLRDMATTLNMKMESALLRLEELKSEVSTCHNDVEEAMLFRAQHHALKVGGLLRTAHEAQLETFDELIKEEEKKLATKKRDIVIATETIDIVSKLLKTTATPDNSVTAESRPVMVKIKTHLRPLSPPSRTRCELLTDEEVDEMDALLSFAEKDEKFPPHVHYKSAFSREWEEKYPPHIPHKSSFVEALDALEEEEEELEDEDDTQEKIRSWFASHGATFPSKVTNRLIQPATKDCTIMYLRGGVLNWQEFSKKYGPRVVSPMVRNTHQNRMYVCIQSDNIAALKAEYAELCENHTKHELSRKLIPFYTKHLSKK